TQPGAIEVVGAAEAFKIPVQALTLCRYRDDRYQLRPHVHACCAPLSPALSSEAAFAEAKFLRSQLISSSIPLKSTSMATIYPSLMSLMASFLARGRAAVISSSVIQSSSARRASSPLTYGEVSSGIRRCKLSCQRLSTVVMRNGE